MHRKKSEYEELFEIIKEAEEMHGFEKELSDQLLNENHVDPEKVRSILKDKDLEQIKKELEEEDMAEVYAAAIAEDMRVAKPEVADKFPEGACMPIVPFLRGNKDKDQTLGEYIYSLFEDAQGVINSEEELRQLKEDANSELNEVLEYMNSQAYEDQMMEKRANYAKQLEEVKDSKKVDDIIKRKTLTRFIKNIDDRYTLAFLFESATPEYVVKAYFDKQKSNYIMERYASKCAQAHLNPEMFKFYFGLEEKFFEEKYWPFNNLFLFMCLSYVSHATMPEDKQRIKMIFQIFHKLFYNKFSNEENRTTVLTSIQKFLDAVIEAGYTKQFKEENITWKEHPHRKEKDKEREKKAREGIYDQIIKAGYEESITEELQAMSISELYAYLDRKNYEYLESCKQKGEEAAKAKAEEDNADDEDEEFEEATEEESAVFEDSLHISDEIEKVETATEATPPIIGVDVGNGTDSSVVAEVPAPQQGEES